MAEPWGGGTSASCLLVPYIPLVLSALHKRFGSPRQPLVTSIGCNWLDSLLYKPRTRIRARFGIAFGHTSPHNAAVQAAAALDSRRKAGEFTRIHAASSDARRAQRIAFDTQQASQHVARSDARRTDDEFMRIHARAALDIGDAAPARPARRRGAIEALGRPAHRALRTE